MFFLIGTAAAQATQLGLLSPWMNSGGRTTQPIGHYEFCQRYTDECNVVSKSDKPVVLTQDLWRKVIEINNQVNTTIEARTDMEMWGKPEVWSYPTQYGDCEDYALLKRKLLQEAGVPINTLLITVVRQMNGDGHAVLTMRTDRGDFVLDNLEPRVLLWNQTEYQYLKRQSTRNTGVWVSIDDDRQVLVGSIKE
ncbi:transglutaminase-like cysteine peptidase [Mesorhizobium sp. RMAD-H1]|uniref:transglutaminase-like cysteine peptidase n=1 Tax=Mesorhizobium sp. RMAD-H1 TaxID=2587065 RepID=UPI0018531DB5|nr:transglutaminase-like cysteine peptidase [Mesorhizobium sp. RMAD-H1]MBB2970889.1 putative transglutaminase-like cysteine proteinase [Mesorhizobium sp. RMAD-H1]